MTMNAFFERPRYHWKSTLKYWNICWKKYASEASFLFVIIGCSQVVVYLHPEYKSTWLGNKSIYRTRMAIADGGELIILAPGVKHFGEDTRIDELIRKYGYRTTPVREEAGKLTLNTACLGDTPIPGPEPAPD